MGERNLVFSLIQTTMTWETGAWFLVSSKQPGHGDRCLELVSSEQLGHGDKCLVFSLIQTTRTWRQELGF